MAFFAVFVLAASLGAMETLSQRRRLVEAMSPEQQEELFRAEHTFRDLQPLDRQHIRDLHDQIENAPDREKLRATMNRYYKWCEAQPLYRREQLRKLSPEERIKRVKVLVTTRSGPSKEIPLDDKNRLALAAWMDRYSAEHAARFIASMAQGSHSDINKLPPDRQLAVLHEMLLRRWQSPGQNGPNGPMPIADPEIDRLRAGLTPELRAKLDAKQPDEQRKIIAEWLRETASHERLRETASHELDKLLADFFENMPDDDGQRDRLMSLPGDQMYDSLSKMYLAQVQSQSKAGELPPRRGDRPRHKDDPNWQRGRRPGGPPPRGTGATKISPDTPTPEKPAGPDRQ